MIAQLKSGKVITGRLAKTLTRIGLSKDISEPQEETNSEMEEVPEPKKRGRKPKVE